MFVKVFVLGRPGSGKSTAIQRVKNLASRWGIPAFSIKDYTILREMFEQGDTRFQEADWGGFDVTDFSALDEALEKLEEKVDRLDNPLSAQKEIMLIEFARRDYYDALKKFTCKFLKDAHFLFIDASLEEACIKRIHKRREGNSLSEDRHSVSDEIMRSYYEYHNWFDTLRQLALTGQGLQHVTTIDNNGLLEEFEQKIIAFAEPLIYEPNVSPVPLQHTQLPTITTLPAAPLKKTSSAAAIPV